MNQNRARVAPLDYHGQDQTLEAPSHLATPEDGSSLWPPTTSFETDRLFLADPYPQSLYGQYLQVADWGSGSYQSGQSVTNAMPSYHARDPMQYAVASRTPNAATAERSSTIFLQSNGPSSSLRSIYTTASHKNGQLQLYEQIDSKSTKTWYAITLQGEFKLNFSPGREREATENDDATQIASSRMQQRVALLKSRWTLIVGLVGSEELSGVPDTPAFFRLAENSEVDTFLGQKQIARLTEELLVPLTLLSRSDASSDANVRDDPVWTQLDISQVRKSIAFLEEWMLALDVAGSVAGVLKLRTGTRLSSYERLNSGAILSLYGESKFIRPYCGEA